MENAVIARQGAVELGVGCGEEADCGGAHGKGDVHGAGVICDDELHAVD